MSKWRTEVQMHPIYDGDTGFLNLEYDDFFAARKSGMSLACCAGTITVKIFSPEGDLHCTYARADNYWHHVHPDAKAIHNAELEEIYAELFSQEP